MKNELPLVSIICLCYNHEKYIRQSVESAINQSYENVEIIIIDDKSTDESVRIISELQKEHQKVKVILLDQNLGNTKAFNKGLTLAKGEYIIDLSTDDILHPDRVKLGIEEFEKYDDSYGVNFTNAQNIDEIGNVIDYHYDVNQENEALVPPPEGDLYEILTKRYFICSPTMMIKSKVLEELNGYDENLTYEDFDFWIRSSRQYKYCYTDKVLIKRKRIKSSMSTQHYGYKSDQMESTFIICNKIKALNRTVEENKALKQRVYLEIKQCIKYFNIRLLIRYIKFYFSI